jgi:hypothetical protein
MLNNWQNKSCLILGGGESLFKFKIPNHPRIIAVNRTIEFGQASIFYSMDTRFYAWLMAGELGDNILNIWKNFKGNKFFLLANYPINNYNFNDDDNIIRIKDKGIVGISDNWKDGIYHGCNSGFGALNLALAFGCNPIYLAGFDMGGPNYKAYKFNTTQIQFDAYYASFICLKFYMDRLDYKQEIYLITPNSRLENLFPYKEL